MSSVLLAGAASSHGARVKLKPDKPDNHWFDCLVGCAVAASLCGLRPAGEPAKPKRPRLKWSEIQRQKREGRR